MRKIICAKYWRSGSEAKTRSGESGFNTTGWRIKAEIEDTKAETEIISEFENNKKQQNRD